MTVDPSDQLIDADTARSLWVDVRRDHPLAGWIVIRDQPEPGRFTARLVTSEPTPYVLIAGTLAELQAMLPPGLTWSRQVPADPPDVVEVWFTE